MTLTEFLLARIAEDEACQHCKHPIERHVGAWCRVPTGALKADGSERICCCEAADSKSRILAECEAKRRIVAAAEDATGDRMNTISEFACSDEEHRELWATDPGARILKALATIWADHPDYQPEWRP